MLFANFNGQKVEATPKTTALCPLCGQTVISKCGKIKVWHWAHHSVESCDIWHEPETEWHKYWKLVFGKAHCEIAIFKNGDKHIADVQTEDNVIIEFQNSPIQKSIIQQREFFYGDNMIWVINGKSFKEHFTYERSRSDKLDEEDEYYHKHSPLANKHGTKPKKNEFRFSWSRCKKSWADVKRQVLIDFGDENLFSVEEGMGTIRGTGKLITKKEFIQKHGGNIELLETVIEKTNDLT